MSNLPNKILVVDDDPSIAQGLEDPLKRQNITLVSAPGLDTAFYHFNQQRFTVVLVELEFAPLSGLALIQKWRKHDDPEKRQTGFIVLAGSQRDAEDAALTRELGDIEIIPKPFTVIQLLPFLSRALARRDRAMALDEMRIKVGKIQKLDNGMEKAIGALRKELPNLGAQGLLLMCDVYEAGGSNEEALTLVERLLEKSENDVSLMNRKGRLLLKLGRFKDARIVMEKADKAAPQNLERIEAMSDMYLKLNEPDKSVSKMKDLLGLNPEQPDIKFSMFEKLNNAGFSSHAQSFCRETTEPGEVVRFYNNKGVALAKEGDRDAAISEYEKALQYFPNFKENYRILFNIGLAYTNVKTHEAYEKAAHSLRRCLELAPDFDKARNALATIEKSLSSQPKKAG